MPNRKVAPALQAMPQLNLFEPTEHRLVCGVPVYELRLGEQDVLKMEIHFNAGRWYEKQEMVARATAQMLKEGTRQRSSGEIAELLDFYGASLYVNDGFDTVAVTLYCLPKHFSELLPLVVDILTEPAFDEKELQIFKERNLRRLLIDLEKNETVAYRILTECLFGESHPYGYNSSVDGYRGLNTAVLREHFERCYTVENALIILAGKTEVVPIEQLNALFRPVVGANMVIPSSQLQVPIQRIQEVEKPNSVQSAIRIGRRLFTRKHPDYAGFYVLNTLLGGYFGSRLMTNLREDKGLTYNIDSSIDTMVHDGYFLISAEVDKSAAAESLEEIYREMKRLCDEPIPVEELEMVRNYLFGTLMTSLDGPFNVAEIVRELLLGDLTSAYFYDLIKTIGSITPKELQALAQRYFVREEMYQVVVG